jgi:hypothetical protein
MPMLPVTAELAVPSLHKIEAIFSNATAPAFFLGAVAAFVSLMTNRLGTVNDRIRAAQAKVDAAPTPQRALHLEHLRRRARMLHDGILLTLCAGICATLLLSELFVTQFFDLAYAYGASLLFMVATLCLVAALIRFAQEAWNARRELELE